MKKIAQIIIAYPKTVICLILAVTIFFGYLIPMVRTEYSVEAFVLQDDPELLYFRKFKQQFGADEFIIVALKSESIFSKETLELIDRMTEQFEELDHTRRVISLTNADDIRGTEEDFVVEPLIMEIPETEKELKIIEERALKNPLFRGDLISEDGTSTAILVKIVDRPGDDLYRKLIVEKIKEILEQEAVETGQRFHLSGVPIIDYYITHYMENDLNRFIPATLVLIALTLYLLFRNFLLVILPMLTVFICLIWTMGFLYIEGSSINNVSTMLPPLIMALSIAIGIHVLAHFRQEFSLSGEEKTALVNTIHRLLYPCFVTTITTGIGFASLRVSQIPPVREFGLASAAGICFSFLVTLSFLPASLSLLKNPLQKKKLKISLLEKGNLSIEAIKLMDQIDRQVKELDTMRGSLVGRALAEVGRLNQKWPRVILLGTVLLCAFSFWGMTKLKVETNFLEFFKKDTEVYQAARFIEDNLSGFLTINVCLESDERDVFKEPEVLHEIEALEVFLYTLPQVDKVTSLNNYIKDMNQSFNNENEEFYRVPETRRLVAQYLLLYDGKDLEDYVDSEFQWTTITARASEHASSKVTKLIDRIKVYLNEHFGDKVTTRVTGISVLDAKLVDSLVKGQVYSLALAFVIISGIIIVIFRSLGVGLVSVVPNMLPIIINFGIMGWLGIPLNTATAMIAPVAIGIAVDDTIHFLSEFGEEIKSGNDYLKAMNNTLQVKGRAIISTSVILFFGFGVLALSNFTLTIQFGLLSAGIMVSALLGDLIVLPVLLVFFRPKF